MRFTITFKKGLKVIAHIEGVKNVDKRTLTVDELDKILEVEPFIEKLTGLRVHINEAAD